MVQVRKIGLLNLNDSVAFLQLREKLDNYYAKIKREGFDTNLVYLAKSRPFTMNKWIMELKSILSETEMALNSYARQDQYVVKALNEDLSKLRSIKEKLEKPF